MSPHAPQPAPESGRPSGRRRALCGALARSGPAVVGWLGAAALLTSQGCAAFRFGELEPPPGELQVVAVDVEGNDELSDGDLLLGLVHFSDNLSLGDKPVLQPSALQDDADRIERHYATYGYFHARVLRWRVDRPRADLAAVVFEVEEGEPTRIASVSVEGFAPDALAEESEQARRLRAVHGDLDDLVSLEVSDVWTESNFRRDKARLQRALTSRGFVHARVFGEVTVDRAEHLASVRYRVSHGPLTTIAEVRVDGADVVSAERIRRRAGLAVGDVLEPERLADAEGEVFDLGVFVFVRVELARDEALDEVDTFEEAEAQPHPASVPVVIAVQERAQIELRTGVGLSVDNLRSDVHGLVGYEHRNPFEALNQFGAQVAPAWIFLPGFFVRDRNAPGVTVRANFRNPSVIEEHVEVAAQVSYELGLDYGYREHDVEGSPRLSRKFWRVLSVYVGYRAEYHEFFDLSPTFKAPAPETLGFTFRPHYVISSLEQGVALDLRDNPVDPRRGLLLALDVAEAGSWLASNFAFFRYDSEARGYWTPWRRLTLAARARFGQVVSLDSDTPISVRLRGGGGTDMRGFGAGRMGPVICLLDNGQPVATTEEVGCPEGARNRVYAGGDVAATGSLETRWHLPSSNVGLVAFVDLGQVWDSAADIDPTHLEVAVGPGLRYQTPIGPLRIDLAFLLTTPTPPDFNFHLSIGQSF